jgi:tRNA-dihydrouridine synthase A
MIGAENTGIKAQNAQDRDVKLDRTLSVAPMMDWTDRHCRYFLRGFSTSVLLYSEMITAEALLRGDAARLLKFSADEQPLALQLGGSDPERLAAAATLGEKAGYREINLNCGCPSDRVHSGAFGACLMAEPERVADCVRALCEAVAVPVTVKMRIGVLTGRGVTIRDRLAEFGTADYVALQGFTAAVRDAGAAAVIVHARQAVLGGLSPKENRDVPPLRPEVVQRLKRDFPQLPMILNGGLRNADQAHAALSWCEGAMLGREAYHRPYVLWEFEECGHPGKRERPSESALLARMADYADRECAAGEPLAVIVRHMLGLLSGRPGARAFRQFVSEGARSSSANGDLLRKAQRFVLPAVESQVVAALQAE